MLVNPANASAGTASSTPATWHVPSAGATVDEYGGWKVKKTKQSRKIDGLVASVIAHSRAAREERTRRRVVSWS